MSAIMSSAQIHYNQGVGGYSDDQLVDALEHARKFFA